MRTRTVASVQCLFCCWGLLMIGTVNAAAPAKVASLLAANRDQQALVASRAYLEQHAADARMRFLHAVALAETGKNDKALALFKKLAKAHPDWPAPANNLAVLYARRGDYAAARRWLVRALKTRPAYATAYTNLREVYAALAAAAYREALGEGKQPDKSPVNLTLIPNLDTGGVPAARIAAANAGGERGATKTRGQEGAFGTAANTGSDSRLTAAAGEPPTGRAKAGQKTQGQPASSVPQSGTTEEVGSHDGVTEVASAPEVSQKPAGRGQTSGQPAPPPTAEAAQSPEAGGAEPLPAKGKTVRTITEARQQSGGVPQPEKAEPVGMGSRQSAERVGPSVDGGQDAEDAASDTTGDAEQATGTVVNAASGDARDSDDKAIAGAASKAAAARALVERWRTAWSHQNVAAYLRMYARNFQPDAGRTLEEWRALRRKRISSPKWIKIKVRGIEVFPLSENRLRVSFVQLYRSNTYRDRVLKTLILERSRGGWRIIRETSLPYEAVETANN